MMTIRQKDMSKTYSFIIPHHNTPDLLQRLIDTIPQREDIEIIVVDDNSDEGKKANVTRSDVRTIFIDKEHTKGGGHARNVGLDAATGKWLLFADSDDVYKPHFIDVLDEYKDSDLEILFFNVDTVDSDTLEVGHDRLTSKPKSFFGPDENKESTDQFLFLRWGPWCKMLRRDYVTQYHFFYEEINNGNDVLFALATSYFAKKWKHDKRVLYSVTYRPDSLTYSKLSKKKYATTLRNFRKREEFAKFIGHQNWVSTWSKHNYLNSIPRYIIAKIKKTPLKGLEILLYYLTNMLFIEKEAKYYVQVVKELAQYAKE